jgi:hypothetical protein
MPHARHKIKAQKHQTPEVCEVYELSEFSDVELKQCSPHLCAICEHAGELVICDGPCHRQFHCTHSPEDTVGHCPGVVIPIVDVADPWLCQDCTRGSAKCFQCGITGAMYSDIRKCLRPYCVRWYCCTCLPLGSASCPLHACITCHQSFTSESLEDAVQCLRCPTTWHQDCLEHVMSKDEQALLWGPDRPPWYHTAHNETRWMVYCPKHPIDPTLQTPIHDHISWL